MGSPVATTKGIVARGDESSMNRAAKPRADATRKGRDPALDPGPVG
jgi:hypothetical protein